MAAKRVKRLTNREKAVRRETKKHLIEQGILPPPKKPLNRKKFAKEVYAELGELTWYEIEHWLRQALYMSITSGEYTVNSEDVGVLKMVKIAIEMKKYYDAKTPEDRAEITVGDIFDNVVLPIRKL